MDNYKVIIELCKQKDFLVNELFFVKQNKDFYIARANIIKEILIIDEKLLHFNKEEIKRTKQAYAYQCRLQNLRNESKQDTSDYFLNFLLLMLLFSEHKNKLFLSIALSAFLTSDNEHTIKSSFNL